MNTERAVLAALGALKDARHDPNEVRSVLYRVLEVDVLTARVAELEAHLRTISTFGGTLDQARELAAKGIERAALLARGKHD